MDRGILSSATVVAASKALVCARLLTYESAEEGKFLESVFRGRSGALENTVFAILAPDGKTLLSRAGRSPEMVFGSPMGGAESTEASTAEMVAAMKRFAAQYPTKPESAAEAPLLPYLVDVRRALDTAACDMLPLAIVLAKDAAARAALEKVLRPLAWSAEFRGRFEWVPAATKAEVKAVAPFEQDATLVILQPDAYGLKGTVLATTAGTEAAALRAALAQGLAKHAPGHKEAQEQIRAGHRDGVDWKTEIPVTDPGALRDHGGGGPPPR